MLRDILPAASRATARRALQRAHGNEEAAVNLLLDSSITPQADDSTPSTSGGSASSSSASSLSSSSEVATASPKGYYVNVITGKTSLISPALHETEAEAASAMLPQISCNDVAKSIEKIGPDFKAAADQIRGYRPQCDF